MHNSVSPSLSLYNIKLDVHWKSGIGRTPVAFTWLLILDDAASASTQHTLFNAIWINPIKVDRPLFPSLLMHVRVTRKDSCRQKRPPVSNPISSFLLYLLRVCLFVFFRCCYCRVYNADCINIVFIAARRNIIYAHNGRVESERQWARSFTAGPLAFGSVSDRY